MTIDAKEAVRLAKMHVVEMFADELRGGPHPPSLEEIWLDELDRVWCVTVGLRDMAIMVPSLSKPTLYKTVRIDAESGELKSIKMHEATL